jgi:NAD(P)-dependent dehydrogenase (short-subunit alcohol dehydrogenase family)
MAIAIDLAGQTALITGGATGLGLAIARRLGQAGARVALNDLTPERAGNACRELSAAGVTCAAFPTDVRDRAAVEEMVRAVCDRFGAPDIVVANAGLYPVSSFLEMREDEWDRVLDTNLKGVFLTCQAAARAMIAAGTQGRIVTMSSGAANNAFWGWSHYCVSKAGVVMLTKAMALELGEHGIRVNAVLPGYIDVPEGGAHLSEAYKAGARGASPLGRPGTPDDIADAVVMLASPLAGFVSGATLSVDGGSGAGRGGVRPTTAF